MQRLEGAEWCRGYCAVVVDNVLWIITDDQMRSSLRSMDRTWKRLVRPGVRFRRGYAAMPLCGPARASILTSLYVHVHGCSTNLTNPRFVARGFDQDTVATRMHAAGYDTGYFGKYMNGHGQEPQYVAPGWDRWVTVVDGKTKMNIDGEVRTLTSSRDVDRFAARRLRRFIRRHRDTGPWFAVFAPSTPHFPYTPSREHRHDFDEVPWDPPAFNEADMRDKPSFLRDLPRQDRDQMKRVLEGKLEELQDLDDQIGKILDLLRNTDQRRRTWIFLISDNGYLLGEHRLFRKEQPYEESAGVPFVARGPHVAPAVVDALVSQVDLMPTTLDIAGLDPDSGRDLDGRSLLTPLITGDWTSWRRRLLIENPQLGWALLREGSTAYIEHDRTGEWELYNLERDPHQLNSRGNADVRRLSQRLDRLRNASGTTLRALEE